jgi:hypothetical protein
MFGGHKEFEYAFSQAGFQIREPLQHGFSIIGMQFHGEYGMEMTGSQRREATVGIRHGSQNSWFV